MLSSNYSKLCAVVCREKEKGNPNRAAKNPMKYCYYFLKIAIGQAKRML